MWTNPDFSLYSSNYLQLSAHITIFNTIGSFPKTKKKKQKKTLFIQFAFLENAKKNIKWPQIYAEWHLTVYKHSSRLGEKGSVVSPRE